MDTNFEEKIEEKSVELRREVEELVERARKRLEERKSLPEQSGEKDVPF